MTVYNWLTLFGVPGLFVALVGFIKVQLAQNKAIKEGLQAILRDRLLQAYKYYEEKGYQQYHTLGANGVMDDIRGKFLALPTRRPNNGGGFT